MKSVVFSTSTPRPCRYAVTSVAGMPRLSSPPLSATPGVRMDTLIGSSMQYPSSRSPKPCQVSPGCSTQASGSVARNSGDASGKATFFPFFSRDLGPVPGVEEPLALRGELAVDPAHRLAERHRFLDRFIGKGHAARPVHHCRRDIVGDDDRVERRGRRLHHERLVEPGVRDRAPPVADVQQRCLGERRQQLVRRMGGEDRRSLVVLGVAVHGVAIAIERVEAGVGVPRLVEVDPVDARVQQLLHPAGVVAEPVIGGVGDHGVHRRWYRCPWSTRGFALMAALIAAALSRAGGMGPMMP